MKERPIIFSTDMVKAILDGKKTQTRRVIKLPTKYQVEVSGGASGDIAFLSFREKVTYEGGYYMSGHQCRYCPYGQVGDRLWVRETWATEKVLDQLSPSKMDFATDVPLWYRTDEPIHTLLEVGKWRPSIFMPRWASRITFEITGVRVERLQEITEEDALAEGITDKAYKTREGIYLADVNGYFALGFACLWDALNTKRGYGWDTNPWVWVISFGRIEP